MVKLFSEPCTIALVIATERDNIINEEQCKGLDAPLFTMEILTLCFKMALYGKAHHALLI